MKVKVCLLSLFLIAGGGLALLVLHHGGVRGGERGEASLPGEAGLEETVQKEADGAAARRYIAAMPDGVILPDLSGPAIQKEIERWEKRIFRYAVSNAPKGVDEKQILVLARKTAALFRLLKQASEREKSGLEPYTALSGFNTMALTFALEGEFEEQTGGTLSDFLYSLDEDLVKKAAQAN